MFLAFFTAHQIGRQRGFSRLMISISTILVCGIFFPLGLLVDSFVDIRFPECEEATVRATKNLARFILYLVPFPYIVGVFFSGMGYFIGSQFPAK
ncbi:MAG: hypothetical protein DWQ47_01010 [Acidobacteria bacterium]|nr:MAG: hypothetical protein DWQ32_11470 [Acidobacteriota bacterium]REK04082.1 MAG: hypothetical protein DWQ38_00995 [Acidobacteriota bacterium]REK15244.1 MAG: hypothetical protein DWQ43_17160 [Acidobacteriota bacterium]REK46334.1 MAG: hypothetical protein DWQ47_01010 [Acidobacteriota bacterium]